MAGKKAGKKYVQVTIRMDKDTHKKYRKWLIDKEYRSINQHINEVIREILKKENLLSSEEK